MFIHIWNNCYCTTYGNLVIILTGYSLLVKYSLFKFFDNRNCFCCLTALMTPRNKKKNSRQIENC